MSPANMVHMYTYNVQSTITTNFNKSKTIVTKDSPWDNLYLRNTCVSLNEITPAILEKLDCQKT